MIKGIFSFYLIGVFFSAILSLIVVIKTIKNSDTYMRFDLKKDAKNIFLFLAMGSVFSWGAIKILIKEIMILNKKGGIQKWK